MKDFLWGVATSAYQIEGAAQTDGKGNSIWDTFSHTPNRVWQDENGDIACDHYHRWEEDVQLIADLGAKSYRFSVAWSRVLPDGTGKVNPKGLDFYKKLTDTLLEKGIAPNITLYHWDLPNALHIKGGWLNRDIADWFAEYADVMFHALGDRVPYWSTINEPWVVAHEGYLTGNHAPGIRNMYDMPHVTHHLLLAHAKAVQQYRAQNFPKGEIGLVVNLEPKEPATSSPKDIEAADWMNEYMNAQFLDPVYCGKYPKAMSQLFGDAWVSRSDEDMKLIQTPFDFLGINYYSRGYTIFDESVPIFKAKTVKHPHHAYTEMGWEVYPDGLTNILLWVQNRYNPSKIFVTENGAAFYDAPSSDDLTEDMMRVAYYREHIAAIQKAKEAGANVKGYYAWSLLDNFEWGYGFSKRFGIVHTDFQTLKRTPKASYYFLQKKMQSI